MRFSLNLILSGLAFALSLSGACPARAQSPPDPRHVQASIVSSLRDVAPGATFELGLLLQIAPGWHIYWHNPGDVGLPTDISWTLPEGWSANAITWPAPRRFVSGQLVSFGYSDEVTAISEMRVASAAARGEANVHAHIDVLACRDECVPESLDVQTRLPVAAEALDDPQGAEQILQAQAHMPRALAGAQRFERRGGDLLLYLSDLPIRPGQASGLYFYPDDAGRVALRAAEPVTGGSAETVIRLPLQSGASFAPGEHVGGVLTLADTDEAFLVDAAPVNLAQTPPRAQAVNWVALIAAMGSAFLGGVILNLMPCVFPILSLKALGLLRTNQGAGRARMEGALYLGGVVTAFFSLAGALILLRSAGAEIGWGFHLQSAPVVGALALLMFAVGLNLSGVFEIGASLQGIGGAKAGAYGTGLLAVAVAAPCTAPFMASALGWALTQPAASTLLVFLGLGVGFAFPFVAIAFVPALRRLLPRPGEWMANVRALLAFPMYGAAAWLVWVFSLQRQSDGLALLLASAIALGLAAWLFGAAQRATRRRAPWMIAAATGAIACVGVGYAALKPPDAHASAVLHIEPWTLARQNQLLAAHTPVFVEFTAAWCVTCRVNELAVLDSPKAATAFRRAGAAYLRGDWTNSNPDISYELRAHGRTGVPFYVMYNDSGAPHVLPQILDMASLRDALAQAKSSAAGAGAASL